MPGSSSVFPPLHLGAVLRRQELRVEPCVFLPQPIVRRRWRVVTKQLLAESGVVQRSAKVAVEDRIGREGEVGVASAQGLVFGRRSPRMEPVEPMRPAAHHNQLVEPGPESRDEAGEGVEVTQLSDLPR